MASAHSRGVAAAALAAAVFAVSWGSILVRLCEAPSLAIAFWRLALSTVVLVPVVLGPGRPGRTALGPATLAGLFLAVHFATWISSLAFTTVASSVVLVSTTPVFTALLAPWFLGERPGPRAWTAVVLALAGSLAIAGGDLAVGGTAWVGDLLALVGAFAVALYFMIGRRVRETASFGAYLATVNAAAAVFLGGFAWVAGTALTGFPSATWGWLALLALVPNLLGHGLLNWSVRRLRALTVNLAVLGEPVLATAYAAGLFGEVPGATFYLGGALILAGVALAAFDERASFAVAEPGP